MPSHLIDLRARSAESSMGPEQSRQDRASTPDSLDERIAGFVSSNAFPPAPPAALTPHERLTNRYREIRRMRRHITGELRHVRHRIAGFQPVPHGRHLSLIYQQAAYGRREADLAARIKALQDYMELHPSVEPDEMDSSDEEIVFGCDPAPVLDCASDSDGPDEVRFHIGQGPDAPVISYPADQVEAYLTDDGPPSRARAAVGARIRSRAVEDVQVLPVPAAHYDEAVAGLHAYSQRTRSSLASLGMQLAPDLSDHEDAGESYESPFDGDQEEEDEDEGEGEGEDENENEDEDGEDDDDSTEPDSSSESEANESNVDPERPPRWQTFHQFFMYSCRGDVSAVTSELQEEFRFEPAVSEGWVGEQLNKAGNIQEQIEYLEVHLPGETGTLDRAEARLRMGLSGLFIQDIYDGKSVGQIFDIDPASGAYTEPIRPADLPDTWTPLLDATLLAVLPDIPFMETFWIENAGTFHEAFEDGIGPLRKERALSLRCGQLKYLKMSEEQLAAGEQREQARIEAWYGHGSELPEVANQEQASA